MGLPGWAGLPLALSAVSLLSAFLGVYWDVSIHIDQGRDPGPLANPAHYFILAGLFGIFASGYLSISLPRGGERPGPAALRIAGNWHAPVGGLLLFGCGTFALMGFPLDDVWHRIFGQDVTLWGPTHLIMIGGAVMTVVGMIVLMAEGLAARDAAGIPGPPSLFVRLRKVGLAGALLIGLSAFQAEFDFGVPQFRMLFEPVMLAFASGMALVFARIWLGRGGAIQAMLFFVVGRGIMALIVGDVFGQSVPHFPLYAAEALCVEAAGIAIGRDRPLQLGVASGLLVGTVGLAAEWGWSQLVMPMPFTSDLLPEALIAAPIAGVAGGVAGALLGAGVRGELPSRQIARRSFGLALATMVVLIVYGLQHTAPTNTRATITLSHETSGPDRTAIATVHLHPGDAADDAAWFVETAWQGGGLVQHPLDRIREGVYRTPQPLPLTGEWKSIVRLQRGNELTDVPVYMPADPAIPVGAIAAPHPTATRAFVPSKEVLQRETKGGIPSWLWTLADAIVMSLWIAFIVALAAGAGRAGRAFERRDGEPQRRSAPRRPRLGIRRPREA